MHVELNPFALSMADESAVKRQTITKYVSLMMLRMMNKDSLKFHYVSSTFIASSDKNHCVSDLNNFITFLVVGKVPKERLELSHGV